MSLIINQKELADTIESLERRINRHEAAIQIIRKAIKEKPNGFQPSVAEYILNQIENIYK